MIAEIIVDVKNKQVNRSFDYIIPSYLENVLEVGYRVKVPFGKLIRTGYVIGIKESTDYSKLKEIIELIDTKRIISEESIEIAKYIAENNFTFYAKALDLMIPKALKVKYKKIARVINKELLPDELKPLFRKNEIILDNLNDDKQKLIYKNLSNNLVLDTKISRERQEKYNYYIHLNEGEYKFKSRKANELYNYLLELNTDILQDELIEDSGYSKLVIKSLEEINAISIYKQEIIEFKDEVYDEYINHDLNNEQLNVFNRLKENEYKTYLLHGVTGSGKTLVYMEWIDKMLKLNKGAIVLVPEISLTPQLTSIFKSRFKSNIAILHSRLSIQDKYNEWKKIINNEVKIVIGARSAIFAPINNLGIIIIDECHEHSYKQDNNPKYSAIEIAKIKASNSKCPLVLGSATPDVIDYYYSLSGEYELLRMPNRANNKPLPDSLIVDMREELNNGNNKTLSRKLQDELIKNYKNKNQSLIFLNRRGYNTFVMCRHCGEIIKCPNCDLSLTYHKNKDILCCHQCGYQTPNLYKCPKCGSSKIKYLGTGTQRIEEEIRNLIPDARIIRIDSDTTKTMADYETYYQDFKSNKADILVGTQMITKGLDFENVTLVGVVNADISMHYPSFDSRMVTFNLIEQASGRAGRANKDGLVIIQTYNPENYVIEASSKHDYEGFFMHEIDYRKLQNLPPFSTLLTIKISSSDCEKCYEEAKIIYNDLINNNTNSIIYKPVENYPFKSNNIFSFIINIQAIDDKVIERIKYIYPTYQNNKDISIDITRN